MAINLKRYFADALIELSNEIPLSKITVRDIAAKVGSGRQTFYNHFKDKNDLIYWIFLQTLGGEHQIMESSGLYAYLVNLYTNAQTNAKFFKEAVKLTGQNSLTDAIYQQTYTYYKRLVQKSLGITELDPSMEFALQFNAHGASNLYIAWLEHNCPGTVEDQALYVLHCIPPCIKILLPLGMDEPSL